MKGSHLIEVENLKVFYKFTSKGLKKEHRLVQAVNDVSFFVEKNETFGIVGESGCGKTTTGKAILQLAQPTAGEIRFNGKNILDVHDKKEKFALKRSIQMIFQDPFSSLDPRYTIGRFIEEPLIVHKIGTRKEQREKTLELMHEVGLREDQYDRYPHELSGGQRQRAGIARALTLNPSVLVCDEPVSALDVSIQAPVLNMMKVLQRKYGLTYIFISHNLSVVKHISDRIGVMYLGNLVELADADELFENPQHPYTKALIDAIPIADPNKPPMKASLSGDVPNAIDPPSGCCFHTRCPLARPECAINKPSLQKTKEGHEVACFIHAK